MQRKKEENSQAFWTSFLKKWRQEKKFWKMETDEYSVLKHRDGGEAGKLPAGEGQWWAEWNLKK